MLEYLRRGFRSGTLDGGGGCVVPGASSTTAVGSLIKAVESSVKAVESSITSFVKSLLSLDNVLIKDR